MHLNLNILSKGKLEYGDRKILTYLTQNMQNSYTVKFFLISFSSKEKNLHGVVRHLDHEGKLHREQRLVYCNMQ